MKSLNDDFFLQELMNLWYELARTQVLLEHIVNKSGVQITTSDQKESHDRAFIAVRNRFPAYNIKKN